jgi:hypothetical protein
MRKFLETKKLFQKIFKKFHPLTPRIKKFPAAATAEGPKKLKIFSRRRRERRQLTSLQALYVFLLGFNSRSVIII